MTAPDCSQPAVTSRNVPDAPEKRWPHSNPPPNPHVTRTKPNASDAGHTTLANRTERTRIANVEDADLAR